VNNTARNKFFIATFFMFTAPLVGFYFAYHYLLNGMIVQLSDHYRLIWGAAVSVLVVQIVIGGFMYSSLNEEEPELSHEEKMKRERELSYVRNILSQKGDLSEFSKKAITERQKKQKETQEEKQEEKPKSE